SAPADYRHQPFDAPPAAQTVADAAQRDSDGFTTAGHSPSIERLFDESFFGRDDGLTLTHPELVLGHGERAAAPQLPEHKCGAYEGRGKRPRPLPRDATGQHDPEKKHALQHMHHGNKT